MKISNSVHSKAQKPNLSKHWNIYFFLSRMNWRRVHNPEKGCQVSCAGSREICVWTWMSYWSCELTAAAAAVVGRVFHGKIFLCSRSQASLLPFNNIHLTPSFCMHVYSWVTKVKRRLLILSSRDLVLNSMNHDDDDDRNRKSLPIFQFSPPFQVNDIYPIDFQTSKLLDSTCFSSHTIRKVKFLSKNSILTKPQHFHKFFTQNSFDNFSREIKVVNS